MCRAPQALGQRGVAAGSQIRPRPAPPDAVGTFAPEWVNSTLIGNSRSREVPAPPVGIHRGVIEPSSGDWNPAPSRLSGSPRLHDDLDARVVFVPKRAVHRRRVEPKTVERGANTTCSRRERDPHSAGRSSRRCCSRSAVPDRPVSGQGIASAFGAAGLGRRSVDVGVLFSANLPARRGVHVALLP